MAQRSHPPFRADHVGSLLRPRSLIEALKRHRAGALDAAGLAAAQDAAIRDAIRLQEAVGLESITDGEFRRASYWSRFVDRVAGLEVREALFRFHNEQGQETEFTAPYAADRVRRTQAIAVDEFRFLREHTGRTAKVTLPSPPTMHFWRLDRTLGPGSYADRAAYFADLAQVYRQELAALAAEGATYVQLDDVPIPMLCDPAIRDRVRAASLDPDRLLDDYIGLFNDCLRDRPEGLTVATHMCRGNYKGHFLSEGGYEALAERFFNGMEVDAFFLEYDTPRAGDFAPLRFVPPGKQIVLGLVSTKTPRLESVDALRARIDDAARQIPLAQLCLSPQCGFASTIAGNPVTEEDEKAKLARVVETAAAVWQ